MSRFCTNCGVDLEDHKITVKEGGLFGSTQVIRKVCPTVRVGERANGVPIHRADHSHSFARRDKARGKQPAKKRRRVKTDG